MTSKNISITEDVYNLLSLLKLEDESFSDTIRRLMRRSDLTGCAGLWSNVPEGELELMADSIGELRERTRESWKADHVEAGGHNVHHRPPQGEPCNGGEDPVAGPRGGRSEHRGQRLRGRLRGTPEHDRLRAEGGAGSQGRL